MGLATYHFAVELRHIAAAYKHGEGFQRRLAERFGR